VRISLKLDFPSFAHDQKTSGIIDFYSAAIFHAQECQMLWTWAYEGKSSFKLIVATTLGLFIFFMDADGHDGNYLSFFG